VPQVCYFFHKILDFPLPDSIFALQILDGNKDKKEKLRLYRQLSLLGIIPSLLAVGPLIGLFAGRWLDSKLGTGPYLMYILVAMGFVAAGKEVYKIVKRVSDTDND